MVSILTDSQLEQFHTNGYLLVENVVPSDHVKAALQAIEDFAGLAIDDPSTWTLGHPENRGLVPLHHAQAFWNNRQYPNVHQLFSQLWETEALWVTMDRASFHPPQSMSQCVLHWDTDPAKDTGYIQGMLYLTDAPEERAAFRCAPEVYRSLNTWIRQQGPNFDYRVVDFSEVPTFAVPGKAGDMVVWKSQLPHCPGVNFDDHPRVAQYITMYKEGNDTDRQNVISWWQQKRPPIWWRGLPTQHDPEPGKPASLTPLGRKLVGLDRW
jgi:ectoine hydroxylase-related dioxygenase (phytanoyl-CoA dioxygenase family)